MCPRIHFRSASRVRQLDLNWCRFREPRKNGLRLLVSTDGKVAILHHREEFQTVTALAICTSWTSRGKLSSYMGVGKAAHLCAARITIARH